MHENHVDILREALVHRNTILSVYSNRYEFTDKAEVQDIISNVDYVIADSRNNSKKISSMLNIDSSHIIDITPFDSRVDFGNSSQLKVKNILVPFDAFQ